MYCIHCGSENPDVGNFCSKCGKTMTSTPSRAQGASAMDFAETELGLSAGYTLAGRYRIAREIGSGGMGRVYLGQDGKLNNMPVAIKVLRDMLSRDGGSVKRLIVEAQLSMQLSHPNVIRVHNFEDDGFTKFLVMEYVEGETLKDRIDRESRLAESETRRLGAEICKGLEHAHAKKVIHRDLKPGNILLGKDGSVKIADFGIARVCRDSMSRLTSQMDSGTLLYMSPEQLDGESTEASDVYSLGVVLYEMLSGDPPFRTGDIAGQIRTKQPKSLENVSEEFNTLVSRCLAKNAADRFTNVRDLMEELSGRGEERRKEAARLAAKIDEFKRRGTRAFDDGNYSEAITQWAAALALKPEDRTLNEAIDRARRKKVDAERAEAESRRVEAEKVATLQELENERQQRLVAAKDQGETAFQQGQYEAAIQHWNAALEISPGNTWISEAIERAAGRLAQQQEAPRRSSPAPIPTKGGVGNQIIFVALGVLLTVAVVWIYQNATRDSAAVKSPSGTNSLGMVFVQIPAGSFEMGSNSGDSDEKPVHRVTISRDFQMQATEVTQGQWESVMGSNPSNFKNCGKDCPVESVSWNEVKEYIRRLNGRNDGWEYRLPTEAEWEYACRAGTTGDYAGNLDSMGWYGPNSGNTTHPVGKKEKNRWGLYDTHGNVWEWVEDWYGPYTSGSATDPKGPSSGSGRVDRGGSWYGVAGGCRSADRSYDSPGDRNGSLGFRLVGTAR